MKTERQIRKIDALLSMKWLISLSAIVISTLVALATLLWLPASRKLVGFFYYSLVSNSAVSWVIPAIPQEPALMLCSKFYAPWLVALAAGIATFLIEIVNYHILASACHFNRLKAPLKMLKEKRLYLLFERWFGTMPFAVILFVALTPIPHWPFRILSVMANYPVLRYAASSCIGRTFWYYLVAWTGTVLDLPYQVYLALLAILVVFALCGRLMLWQKKRQSRGRYPVKALSSANSGELKKLPKAKAFTFKRVFKGVSGLILLSIFSAQSAFSDGKPPLRDPRIPHLEKATYKLNEKGKVSFFTYTVSRENHNGQEVYVILSHSYKMVVKAYDLRPLSIQKIDSEGKLEFAIEYKHASEHRVHFSYPERNKVKTISEDSYDVHAIPERNKVKAIPEDSYDVHTIIEALRGYPFNEEKEIKFTLVTPNHVVRVYAKVIGSENMTTPLGAFDCYSIEIGISGLIGKVVRTKFLLWIEKAPPHRLIKLKDSNDERIVNLVKYEVLPGGKIMDNTTLSISGW